MVEKIRASHPEGLTDAQESLALGLFGLEAIKFGEFRLKIHEDNPDLPPSMVYFDLRLLRRNPPLKSAAVSAYQELVRELKFDLLADVPTAATPIVSTLSDRLRIGFITPRTDSKSYGTGAKIDGFLSEDVGKRVVLIDDVVTSATSKIEALEILRAQGLVVEDIVVLIDRQQGGKELLEGRGLRLHSVFTLNQLLSFYLRLGKISQDRYGDIQKFSKSST